MENLKKERNPKGISLSREIKEFRLLLRSVPSSMLIFFVSSVFLMNLMANKSIDLPYSFLALDCGILVSWFAFLTMDMVTKHFGPKAATEISFFAMGINVVMCAVFYIVSLIPGRWGESFVPGSEEIINNAINNTFGGTWYIILGSAIAFLTSSVVNNFVNYYVGKAMRKNPDGMGAFICRSYVSTAIGQFTDNFVFAFLVSRTFFGWTLIQCITCSLMGMLAELLCEGLFSYFGYCVCEKWKNNNVGEEYFAFSQGAA